MHFQRSFNLSRRFRQWEEEEEEEEKGDHGDTDQTTTNEDKPGKVAKHLNSPFQQRSSVWGSTKSPSGGKKRFLTVQPRQPSANMNCSQPRPFTGGPFPATPATERQVTFVKQGG